ncbi:class I SAM-dependent methyltransferase [Aeromonas hydrophila]|uniref:class I SAM-dependent methyltransferase n=1 Tax=Aeromonas hydrophila TaxID=644 RepID=UPI0020B3DF16|nr:class I SAM-dependent methyltransferase [Aeromonas hydrophila]MCP3288002.1 class I SAM-dependent methyltransferase [Aeromonas hydrophila]
MVAPRRLLDVGAGSGRDAAFLAGLNSGHHVVAVEPCHAFSALGQHHTRTLAVTWVNDSMPALSHVIGPFDLILLSAVWMHLSLADRPLALARLGELLSPQGYLVLSLRFSLSEQEMRERAMFPVSLEEVECLARKEGLTILHASALQQDVMARGELSWQSLILGETHARLP